jgi:hypothetical protein
MALCLWGPVQIHFVSGNPDLWITMFLALSTVHPAFASFVFIKPSVAFFGLWRVRSRAWWYGFVPLSVMSLLLLPLWFDWLRVVLNSRGTGGLLYSWQEMPLLLIPMIAWLARPGGRYDLERRVPHRAVLVRSGWPELAPATNAGAKGSRADWATR